MDNLNKKYAVYKSSTGCITFVPVTGNRDESIRLNTPTFDMNLDERDIFLDNKYHAVISTNNGRIDFDPDMPADLDLIPYLD